MTANPHLAGTDLRILHVVTTCAVGGAERHLLGLCRDQVAAGWTVTVAYFKESEHGSRSLVGDFEAAGVRVVRIGSRRNVASPVIRLVRVIRQFAPDVLHSHLYRADLAAAAVKVWNRRLPWVASVHNVDFETTYRRWRRTLMWAYRRADRVIAISRAVAEQLARHGVLQDRIRVIHYGLPISARRVLERKPGAVVGTTGRLTHQKAHDVLIQAHQLVRAVVPSARLRIAGHDEGGLATRYRALANSLGTGDFVEVLGYVDDVATFLDELDVFVLPSRWEGFGLVLLEAMAAQRPIVATRVGPIPEILMHGETALLVDPEDPETLAEAIALLLTDRPLARRLASRASDDLERRFTSARVTAHTSLIYREVVTGTVVSALLKCGENRTRECDP